MVDNSTLSTAFTAGLMHWHYQHNRRTMPWKGEPDAYKIWLSEIMLQQTRVEQGLGYYLRFTEALPDVFSLAAAPDADVFKLWEGLGYYSRCRNLLHTARTIVEEYGGIFPGDYQKLLKLKGIGPYTAAAIASFGFGLPYAVVDGNVIRVLSRFFMDYAAFDSPAGKKAFQAMADLVLDKSNPAAFNQAIMDFGATICRPALPQCGICPLNKDCLAFANNIVHELPVKQKKAGKKERYFVQIILNHYDKAWIRERVKKDIWRHLHEFYLVELPSKEAFLQFNGLQFCLDNNWQTLNVEENSDVFEQALTHQLIKSKFVWVELRLVPNLPEDGKWVNSNRLHQFAFPKTITRVLSSPDYFLPK